MTYKPKKPCPCCDRLCLEDEDVINPLSHIDNKTHIWLTCGQNESIIGIAPDTVDPVGRAVYERWQVRCKK